MDSASKRLYFIDAIRAWAILMMLQGHFIDGLLDNAFRDTSNTAYTIWKYFRGITAPVFFTVSGFIFTFLLIRNQETGLKNPRIKKGVKRGLELLFIGYLLRTNLLGLINGEIYASFYLVDVLHCIGLSILGIIALYLLTQDRKKLVFPVVLVAITLLLFLFEPIYKQWDYSFLPVALANYVSKANGSVFTFVPWFGYAAFGGAVAVLFSRYRTDKWLYPVAIGISLSLGFLLISFSSDFFMSLANWTGIPLFSDIYYNNYLFIRLGDVLLVFALFMFMRNLLNHTTLIKIGQSTLTIYVIHFIILYGSFTGFGLYRFLHHSLSPITVIIGALLFVVCCTYLALGYEKYEVKIKDALRSFVLYAISKLEIGGLWVLNSLKTFFYRLLRKFGIAKN
ncbi:acyltransferase family protein [Pareuzebyella sediminis]|uniref:acyltransferase family protein n=1 Tax=Pareuzebyella sediminis TaxID=2607998 RepID=UPI0011EECBCC|nr:acyltransferase family protein [Pareuzebyella sediminis]